MSSAPAPTPDKDLPLKEDIRLLGRLLGDTIREQEGEAAFAAIESIRQAAVRFRRDGDGEARRELEAILARLSHDETIVVIRAFAYFSQLANLAEDLHRNRRRRAHELAGAASREGLAVALERVHRAGVGADAVAAFFAEASIQPVLTAHPTEVQRKSILDALLGGEKSDFANERRGGDTEKRGHGKLLKSFLPRQWLDGRCRYSACGGLGARCSSEFRLTDFTARRVG